MAGTASAGLRTGGARSGTRIDTCYRQFVPGWYRVRLYATDPAGNKQAVVGRSVLLVKRQPGARTDATGGGGAGRPTRLVYAPRASALGGAAAGWMPAEVRAVFARLAKHLQ